MGLGTVSVKGIDGGGQESHHVHRGGRGNGRKRCDEENFVPGVVIGEVALGTNDAVIEINDSGKVFIVSLTGDQSMEVMWTEQGGGGASLSLFLSQRLELVDLTLPNSADVQRYLVRDRWKNWSTPK